MSALMVIAVTSVWKAEGRWPNDSLNIRLSPEENSHKPDEPDFLLDQSVKMEKPTNGSKVLFAKTR